MIKPLDDIIEICMRESENEIDFETIKNFQIRYSQFVAQQTSSTQSGYDLCRADLTKLSYGMELFDLYFPSLQANGIIEIAGEAGSGKSQICMQILTLAMVYYKLPCYYITDKRFMFTERLQSMEKYFCELLEIEPIDVCSRLNIAKVDTFEQFQSVLQQLNSKNIKMFEKKQQMETTKYEDDSEIDITRVVVIDCIGSIFRNSFEDKYDQRSEGISWTGTMLQELVDKGCIVITTNEAVDKVDDFETNNHYDFLSMYSNLQDLTISTGLDVNCDGKVMTSPSGIHWGYFVTHRLFLFKTQDQIGHYWDSFTEETQMQLNELPEELRSTLIRKCVINKSNDYEKGLCLEFCILPSHVCAIERKD